MFSGLAWIVVDDDVLFCSVMLHCVHYITFLFSPFHTSADDGSHVREKMEMFYILAYSISVLIFSWRNHIMNLISGAEFGADVTSSIQYARESGSGMG